MLKIEKDRAASPTIINPTKVTVARRAVSGYMGFSTFYWVKPNLRNLFYKLFVQHYMGMYNDRVKKFLDKMEPSV